MVSYRALRRNPHLFSDDDVNAACARASTPSPLRAATLTTMIGLLVATGMRVGEAIRLNRDVVHLGAMRRRDGQPLPGERVLDGWLASIQLGRRRAYRNDKHSPDECGCS